MLEHVGTIRNHLFFYNTKYGTYTVYKNGVCVANPTTVERLFEYMSMVGKTRIYNNENRDEF
jgi:hypothetical protein